VARIKDQDFSDPQDVSVLAFEAVVKAVGVREKPNPTNKAPSPTPHKSYPLSLSGRKAGTVKRTKTGIALTLEDSPFADWVEIEAQKILNDLHARWLQRSED